MFKHYKQYINFYKKEDIASYLIKKTFIYSACIIFAIIFLWFGIISRYLTISNLQNSLSEKKSELAIVKDKNEALEVTDDEYRRYSNDYLSNEENKIVRRDVALNIIDDYLFDNTKVIKIQIEKNEITASLYDTSMSLASNIINKMLMDENDTVEYATTKSAISGKNHNAPTVDMLIKLNGDKS